MARKRLTPAQTVFLDGADPAAGSGAETGAPAGPGRPRAPIAQVAGATATEAALAAVTDELRSAERDGRMIRALPLAQIETGYLHRDRMEAEPEALATLTESLRARGQQTPVEVAALDPAADGTPRWGLISGWRRVLALQALHAETAAPRFATVLALVRRPEDSSAAYLAMVEENEIRAGLSFYERARVVRRAVEAGAFATEQAALQGLFGTVSKPKRSKIKSFIAVVAALDGALRFPTHIPERTGLRLAKALETPGFAKRLRAELDRDPPATPEAEARRLAAALAGPKPDRPVPPGVALKAAPGRVVLEGAGVDDAFTERLAAWLKAQGLG